MVYILASVDISLTKVTPNLSSDICGKHASMIIALYARFSLRCEVSEQVFYKSLRVSPEIVAWVLDTLTITLVLRLFLQNSRRRVVDSVLNNISAFLRLLA